MKQNILLLLLITFYSLAQAGNNNNRITVAQDGSGDYKTVQEAIDAAPDNSKTRFIIFIKKGNYNTQKLIVPASKKNITLLGEDREKTIISYHMHNCTNPETGNLCPAESWQLWKDNKDLLSSAATLTVMADDFIAENLTISNTAGPVAQAQAITLYGNRIIFRNCNLLGYQDTIFMRIDAKLNYFENCLVLGRTDYIYGGGIGYFESCEIRSWGGGWVTAPSTPENQPYGFIFNHCKFTYASNSPRKGDEGEPIAIGRPWHKYPKVTILNSELCEQMHPEGWPTIWNMDYASTSEKLHLYEYNNTGKGADMSQRAKWKGLKALNAKEAKSYSMKKVLGNWNLKKQGK